MMLDPAEETRFRYDSARHNRAKSGGLPRWIANSVWRRVDDLCLP